MGVTLCGRLGVGVEVLVCCCDSVFFFCAKRGWGRPRVACEFDVGREGGGWIGEY